MCSVLFRPDQIVCKVAPALILGCTVVLKPSEIAPLSGLLFAEITALLEDAHEIAVRGQNSKLERADYVKATEELREMLDQIRLLSRTIRNEL